MLKLQEIFIAHDVVMALSDEMALKADQVGAVITVLRLLSGLLDEAQFCEAELHPQIADHA